MHYLITGGSGFIGGHLTESLLADGRRVTVVDNYSTGCGSSRTTSSRIRKFSNP